MSLITDLRAAGSQLTGDDVPAPSELHQVVGAIVKTLELAGVTVAEDLLPKAADDVINPAVVAAEPAAAAAATDALTALVQRAEEALAKLEHHDQAPAPSPAPSGEPQP